MAHEIVRRLVDGIWRTVDIEAESGGGGSLPPEWTVSETVNEKGSLLIETDTTTAFLNLQNSADANATISLGVSDVGGGAVNSGLAVESVGGGTAQLRVWNHSAEGTIVFADGRGLINLFTELGLRAFEAWDDEGNVLRFALLPAGQPMIGVVAAPADGDLSAGQCALWFDATHGAAKLMVKAKDANGSVVTGEVALA